MLCLCTQVLVKYDLRMLADCHSCLKLRVQRVFTTAGTCHNLCIMRSEALGLEGQRSEEADLQRQHSCLVEGFGLLGLLTPPA